jgi:hypothetical protein
MDCPFTYSDGRKCTGTVYRAHAYGRNNHGLIEAEDHIRKIRLWCSEKDDHAGPVSSLGSKNRMEFYPD